ncbi:MAG: ABC transporter permease subunit [bacterium]
MSRELTDIFQVAGHDFRDSIRSRRLVVWVLLYLSVACAGTFIFSRVLREIETQISKAIAVDASKTTGQVTVTLQKSEAIQKTVRELISDERLVNQILTLHPLVIFFAWFTFTFMPLLVIIICSDAIARDINTRHVRFFLFRTSRSAYAVGKGVSSAFLLLIALSCSAIATYVTGALDGQVILDLGSAFHMLLFLLKSWFLMLSYLGIALMASQLRRSPLQAQSLALMIFFILAILHPIASVKTGPGFARLWSVATILSPSSTIYDLWHPALANNLKSITRCLGLGFIYFFLGFLYFSKRDV